MKKKLSILLIITMMIFAFVPALTLAQDEVEEEQETVIEESEETVDQNEEETAADSEQEADELEESEESYQNLEALLADLDENEELSSSEKVALQRKLTGYDQSLKIDTMSSVVDKILNEEIDLGQGFVILRNLDESVNNGIEEDRALEMINNYPDQEGAGQFAFQTALELRKLSREDLSEDKSEAFADEVDSIIEENGAIETSELKQLAAEYRKDAREEKREEMKAARAEKSNSASESALKNGKANNASENALNKDQGNSGNSNSNKGSKGKGSNKSPNSNANKNAK